MKQVIVTFDFDPETEAVSGVKCTVDGVEKKRKTTKKVKDVEEMASSPIITLEPNKIVFNNKAVSDLNIAYEDRIVIKWVKSTEDNKTMLPIIGKDSSFGEEGTGNKVTKSNTVTYKGKANTILSDFGTEFTITPYDSEAGIWNLVPTSIVTAPSLGSGVTIIKDIINQAENTEPELLVNTDDEDTKIDDLGFYL